MTAGGAPENEPCPVCQATADSTTSTDEQGPLRHYSCPNCGSFATREDAARLWSQRDGTYLGDFRSLERQGASRWLREHQSALRGRALEAGDASWLGGTGKPPGWTRGA